jgi:2-haloacid dehalogenase
MQALPKAFIFDVFGTLVDWRTGLACAFAEMDEDVGTGFDPHEFADLWRAEYQPAMQRIRSGNRGYVPLEILHRENLDIVLEKTDLSNQFDAAARIELNSAWEKLPAWPDVSTGLARLKQQAVIAPCSNGSIAIMARLAKFANLPWDAILGADIARDYKPKAAVYLQSCTALALDPGDVMMVAAHNDDLVAARQAGLQCGFVSRPLEHGKGQKTDLFPQEKWEISAKSLTELCDVFGIQ